MGVPKHVLAFDSLCGARTGVATSVLAFDIAEVEQGISNVLRQSLWSLNGG